MDTPGSARRCIVDQDGTVYVAMGQVGGPNTPATGPHWSGSKTTLFSSEMSGVTPKSSRTQLRGSQHRLPPAPPTTSTGGVASRPPLPFPVGGQSSRTSMRQTSVRIFSMILVDVSKSTYPNYLLISVTGYSLKPQPSTFLQATLHNKEYGCLLTSVGCKH